MLMDTEEQLCFMVREAGKNIHFIYIFFHGLGEFSFLVVFGVPREDLDKDKDK